MIGLAAICLVLMGAVALATSSALGVTMRWLTTRIETIEPRLRIRVISALILLPLVVAAATVLLAFGPCLGARLAGVPDDCAQHGGPHLFLCLQRGGSPSALAWFLGAGLVARALYVLVGVARAARTTARLAGFLRLAGRRREAEGYVVVSGPASFTAGWPRGEVFIGSDLIASLDAQGLAAVVAHERAHQDGGDVLVKLLARAIAMFHVPVVGRRLADELDAALEQACDADAARVVGDPVRVAESLVAVARLGGAAPLGALAGFTDAPAALARRVTALCEPPWSDSTRGGRLGLRVGFLGIALVTFALAFGRQVHDAIETLLQVLGS